MKSRKTPNFPCVGIVLSKSVLRVDFGFEVILSFPSHTQYKRQSSHEIVTQPSHVVARAGWVAKMASIELWTLQYAETIPHDLLIMVYLLLVVSK